MSRVYAWILPIKELRADWFTYMGNLRLFGVGWKWYGGYGIVK